MTKSEKLAKLKIARDYYPDADIELNNETGFQLLVAVMLSAQTTDKAVNKATEELFKHYKEARDFRDLTYDEIYDKLRVLGLAKTKSKNLMKLAEIIDEEYEGEIPDTREKLMELPGVGQKTANVVLSNLYQQNYIAVDTHIERISKRLGIVKQKASVLEVEDELEKVLKGEDLKQFHHSLIFFGRYHCKAKKPDCGTCVLKEGCNYYKKNKK